MNKDIFIANYIEIDRTSSNRKEKLNAYTLLMQETNDINDEELADIIDILKRKNYPVKQVFFNELIYPKLTNHLSLKNIKVLLELEKCLLNRNRLQKEPSWNFDTLLTKALEIDPNDIYFLQIKHQQLQKILFYAIHELPNGILFNSNGATIDEMTILLSDLKQFVEITAKLNRHAEELIRNCSFYFTHYQSYLIQDLTISFEEYLLDFQNEIHTKGLN